jgi:hypothetical protein
MRKFVLIPSSDLAGSSKVAIVEVRIVNEDGLRYIAKTELCLDSPDTEGIDGIILNIRTAGRFSIFELKDQA